MPIRTPLIEQHRSPPPEMYSIGRTISSRGTAARVAVESSGDSWRMIIEGPRGKKMGAPSGVEQENWDDSTEPLTDAEFNEFDAFVREETDGTRSHITSNYQLSNSDVWRIVVNFPESRK